MKHSLCQPGDEFGLFGTRVFREEPAGKLKGIGSDESGVMHSGRLTVRYPSTDIALLLLIPAASQIRCQLGATDG